MVRRALSRYSRLLLLTLLAAGIGAIFFLGTIQYGLVSGDEFAPDTFQRRSYWYYELPAIRLKVTPVMRRVQRDQLEQLLVNKKYVVPKPPPNRWDLATARRGADVWRRGDAQILFDYLDAMDMAGNGVSYWETWTLEHPELAKVFWPEIARLARSDLYFLIPPVFETVLGHEEPERLQNDLDRLLARKYDILAAAEVELGNFETAIRFYNDALRHQPGRTTSLAGRAACYEQLGEAEQAVLDRQSIADTAEAVE